MPSFSQLQANTFPFKAQIICLLTRYHSLIAIDSGSLSPQAGALLRWAGSAQKD